MNQPWGCSAKGCISGSGYSGGAGEPGWVHAPPSVYAPCPTCHDARFNAKTLEIKIRGKSVADVRRMTADAAFEFFATDPQLRRSLDVIREVGLGYIRLGQPATELSGGEAQRVKLATELQRIQRGEGSLNMETRRSGLVPDSERKVLQLVRLPELLPLEAPPRDPPGARAGRVL